MRTGRPIALLSTDCCAERVSGRSRGLGVRGARREDLPGITVQSGYLPGQQYSYDGSQVIQTTSDQTSLPTGYLRMPGSGAVLMESPSTGDAEVPLADGAGSTTAMVDAVTGATTSQYTYDPLGGVTVSGTGYETEYQYLGMENDGFAYYGGNRYYSPVMGRFLSLSGPLSSAGGFGSGVAPVAAAMGATSPSDARFSPIDPQIPEDASAGAAAGFLAGSLIGTESGGSFGPEGAVFGMVIGGVVGFFSDLLGGGNGGAPGWVVWKLNHQGGNLQLWAQIIGIDPTLAPSWLPTARIQLVGDNTPPLQKQPEIPNARPYPPGNLNFFNSCNVFSLSVSGTLCGAFAFACGASALGEPEDAPVNVPACVLGGTSCIAAANDLSCCITPHVGCKNPDRDFTQMK